MMARPSALWALFTLAVLVSSRPADAVSAAKCRSFLNSSIKKIRSIENQCTSLARQAVDFNSCTRYAQTATSSQNTLVSIFNTDKFDYTHCSAKFKPSEVALRNAIQATINYCHGLYNDACSEFVNPPAGGSTGGGGGSESACEMCSVSCQALCSSCANSGDCGSIYVAGCASCPGANPYCCS